MCTIYLTEELRINFSDGRNYVPEVLQKNQHGGEDYWKGYGYCGSLSNALEKIIESQLMPKDSVMTLKKYADVAKNIRIDMLEKIKEEIRIVSKGAIV